VSKDEKAPGAQEGIAMVLERNALLPRVTNNVVCTASGICCQDAFRCCIAPALKPEQHDAHATYMRRTYCSSGCSPKRTKDGIERLWPLRYVYGCRISHNTMGVYMPRKRGVVYIEDFMCMNKLGFFEWGVLGVVMGVVLVLFIFDSYTQNVRERARPSERMERDRSPGHT
jgi:hypothetical protein